MAYPPEAKSPSGTIRILVVDDEEQELRKICDTLRSQGYAPTGFTSATKAIEALQPLQYDLMLTDLTMPVVDGIGMLKAALEKDPLLMGIVMTGHGTINSAVEAMKAGALDFILKPIDLRRFQKVLSRALEVRELRIENEKLHSHIKARSEELEAANKELEAFSYSVSHDLRAPLRAVSAFSQMLVRDHAEQLPDEARELAERIHVNAARMGELIEDLLLFSRLTRQPLNKRLVNMEQMVREVLEEVAKERQGGPVEVKMGKLPEAWGDASLLRQVWMNLLSNAFKFTRYKPKPCVEIGWKNEGAFQQYFVKDNGAGFNQNYADKLFGVFQRLHRADEFEGTGIGLSIVQRIVQRQGGKVWAEGEEEKGAAFYFTLPQPRTAERN